ncbi:MAG: tetratricopeptide repeat protein [Cyanobacteria bacterium P01_A01_bin.45]
MTCCLNSDCHNPPAPDGTKFCPNCGFPLVILRNRYRPIKTLGGGGFGKTYLAEDVDKLNELCVIKQFAPQLQGTAGLQKATELFEQEARRLQQLGEHPQIPTLLAYFREDDRLYLMQQFIDGQNLLEKLQQQTFTEKEIWDLLQSLLSILKIVHQQKVIHRDIKPENIIQLGDGKVVLIDFGASKLLTQSVIAGLGTMIGSFGYASLEQMHGGQSYPASDLYSLGATCFHLLSKIHPWELWKSQGYGWVEHWRKHLKQPVSEELGKIIDNLLKEDYHQRYQSAEEVLQALALNSQPSQPKPVIQSVTSSPTPKVKQNQVLGNIYHSIFSNQSNLIFIAISSLIFIGGGIIYVQAQLHAEAEKLSKIEIYKTQGLEKHNSQNFQGAIEDYNRVIEIKPKNADAYYQRGLAQLNLGSQEKAIQDFRQAAKLYTEQGKPGNAKRSQGIVHEISKQYQEAIADYTEAISLNSQDFRAYINRGNAYKALKNRQSAIQDYKQAIQINSDFAIAHNNLCTIRNDLKNYQAAIKDCTQAIQLNSKFALAYSNRGNAYSNLNNKQAALEDYKQAILFNPNLAIAHNNLCTIRNDLKTYQEAIENCTQAIQLNPKFALNHSNRCLARHNVREYQAAIEDCTQAIRLNPNDANAYNNRGSARVNASGNKQLAIEDFSQAIKKNPKLVVAYSNRGNIRRQLGQNQGAIEDYNQAIKLSPNNAVIHNNRGVAYSALGNKQAAIADYRKAADLHRKQGNTKLYQDSLNNLKKLEG